MKKLYLILVFLVTLLSALVVTNTVFKDYRCLTTKCKVEYFISRDINMLINQIDIDSNDRLIVILPGNNNNCDLEEHVFINSFLLNYSTYIEHIKVVYTGKNTDYFEGNVYFINSKTLSDIYLEISKPLYILLNNKNIEFIHVDFVYDNEYNALIHKYITSKIR